MILYVICFLILYVAFHVVPHLFEVKVYPKKPLSWTLRLVSWVESLFGLLVLFAGIYIHCFVFHSVVVFCILALLGMLWMLLGHNISCGNERARRICKQVSIIRFASVFGIPFSACSLFLLSMEDKKRGT